MTGGGLPGHGWTVVLRRMPIRIVAGQQEGGFTDAFEIVCCDCGDDPDLDYREVSPELQRIRGPYHPMRAGAAAYARHVAGHGGPRPVFTGGLASPAGFLRHNHPGMGEPPRARRDSIA